MIAANRFKKLVAVQMGLGAWICSSHLIPAVSKFIFCMLFAAGTWLIFEVQQWIWKSHTPLHREFWRRDLVPRRPTEAGFWLGGRNFPDVRTESRIEEAAHFEAQHKLQHRVIRALHVLLCLFLVYKKSRWLPTMDSAFLWISVFFSTGLLMTSCQIQQLLRIPLLILIGVLCALFRSNLNFESGVLHWTVFGLFLFTTFGAVMLADRVSREILHPKHDRKNSFSPRGLTAEREWIPLVVMTALFFGSGMLGSRWLSNRGSWAQGSKTPKKSLEKMAQASSGGSQGSGGSAQTASTQTKPKSEPVKALQQSLNPTPNLEKMVRWAIIALALGVIAAFLFSKKHRGEPDKKTNTLKDRRAQLMKLLSRLAGAKLDPEQEIIQKYCAFLEAMDDSPHPHPEYLPTERYSEQLRMLNGSVETHLGRITEDHSDVFYGSHTVTPGRLGEFRRSFDQVINHFMGRS